MEKKTKFLIVIIGILIVLASLVLIVMYVYYQTKVVPNIQSINETINNQSVQQQVQETTSGFKKFFYITLGLFFIVGIIVLVYYFFFKKSKDVELPETIFPQDAYDLFLPKFCKDHDIQGYFFEKKFMLVNPTDVEVLNPNPHFKNKTGEKFYYFELHTKRGRQMGICSVWLPLQRGEESIQKGDYRIDHHTPLNMMKLREREFPMSSISDQEQRFKLLALEGIENSEDKIRALEMLNKPQVDPRLLPQKPAAVIDLPPPEQEEGEPVPVEQRPYPRKVRRKYKPYYRGY